MLLRCMLKFKRLACGSEDVAQCNTFAIFSSIKISSRTKGSVSKGDILTRRSVV